MIVHVQSVQEKGNTMAKRRTFNAEFKARVVLEELTGEGPAHTRRV
jgi:transposase-like protein